MIKVKDMVLHTLSGNYYRCENVKHERWMNWNPFYKVVSEKEVPAGYFDKDKMGH